MTENPLLDAAWARFDRCAERDAGVHILDLYAAEPDRLAKMSLAAAGVSLDAVAAKLQAREGRSGLEEKASRGG